MILEQPGYEHWKRTLTGTILWCEFDRADSSINTIHLDVLRELNHILDNLEPSSSALVIASSKEHGFSAGADLKQFVDLSQHETIMQLIDLGHQVFDKLAALSIPTIAVCDGYCLGGGMELALACQFRVAVESTSTILGLPEVTLGLAPGWGGTVRLPRLIGAHTALPLIIEGRCVSAKEAKSLGMVDWVVPKRQVRHCIETLMKQETLTRRGRWRPWFFDAVLIRRVWHFIMKRRLEKKIHSEHEPAPYAILETWRKRGVYSCDALYQETVLFQRLIQTSTAANLLRTVHLRQSLKQLGASAPWSGRWIHVLGAGTMGAEIAACCVLAGFEVSLQDENLEALCCALKRIQAILRKKASSQRHVMEACDRLFLDQHGWGVATADAIIEAVPEDLELKKKVFASLEKEAKKDALLATNTSCLLLSEISGLLQEPDRLVGLHFFNPASKMPLVEVIFQDDSKNVNTQSAIGLVHALNKLPLPVKSSPGFLVNWVLFPYMIHAMHLCDEGYHPDVIDKIALDFGMPIGPLALADLIGLDVCLTVAERLEKAAGFEIPSGLRSRLEHDKLGRKNNHGYHAYVQGRPKKIKNQTMSTQGLQLGLMETLMDAAETALDRVDSCERVDAGLIFGAGFPAHTGGPLHYRNRVNSHLK